MSSEFHSYNHGLVTSLKGCALEGVRVTFGASGAPTLVDKGASNVVASVAKAATGRYTVTLTKPYAADMVACLPGLTCVAVGGAILHARVKEGSYSASAGTFEVTVTDNAGSPAAADPTDGSGLDLVMLFQRYNSIS